MVAPGPAAVGCCSPESRVLRAWRTAGIRLQTTAGWIWGGWRWESTSQQLLAGAENGLPSLGLGLPKPAGFPFGFP